MGIQESIPLLLLILHSAVADRRQSTIERAQLAIRKHIELSPHRSRTELSNAVIANPRAPFYSMRNQTYTFGEGLISSSTKCGRAIEELKEPRVTALKKPGTRIFWGCRDQFTCCEWGCCYDPDTRSDRTILLWACAFIFAAVFLFLLLMAIRRVGERKNSEVLFKAPPCSLGVISSCNHSAAEHKKSIVIVEGEARKKSTVVMMKKGTPTVIVEELV
ncbi:hypothetical protein PMAYCL1PPCAC_17307 [Pristionchus mayeri]|uniref:CX domain-containing protein n=1 Tax=Pristionchus mayeri TaxID=1317129 RepID=A0AAN5I070_9BILA|nr:hypothetical protein PMAYCL1PPCAC_17307 [Pristionchus mayeri]